MHSINPWGQVVDGGRSWGRPNEIGRRPSEIARSWGRPSEIARSWGRPSEIGRRPWRAAKAGGDRADDVHDRHQGRAIQPPILRRGALQAGQDNPAPLDVSLEEGAAARPSRGVVVRETPEAEGVVGLRDDRGGLSQDDAERRRGLGGGGAGVEGGAETLHLRGELFLADLEDAATNGGQQSRGVVDRRAVESAAAAAHLTLEF